MMSAELLCGLEKNGIEYKTDCEIKSFSTFRIGGRCSIAIFPESSKQLAETVRLLDRLGICFFTVGKGSNTLVFDGYIDKAIIFTHRLNQMSVKDNRITAEAGAGLVRLASYAAKNCLSGLEFASGIPGSVGGALYMNAGAYGECMEDVTLKSRAYDRNSGNIIEIAEHCFSYRDGIYKKNKSLLCLDAEFALETTDEVRVLEKMKVLAEQRKSKQPLEYPSAGSYFKRPVGDYAGRLIEACGLKGLRIGGAEVSEKHAGFIVNRGNASFDDVMRLEEAVKEKVYAEYGIELEREVEVIK